MRELKQDCGRFHPVVEEPVESLLLDIWSRAYHRLEGGKASSDQASTFQALLRVPSTAELHLQRLQVPGVYFEPGSDDGFAPHDQYSVIWLPMLDKAAVVHQLRTLDRAIALARLGKKFGVRTRESDEAELFRQLRPGQEYIKVKVNARYKLHPLPFGCQRKTARPLQPSRGDGVGSSWEIGTSEEPPSQALLYGDKFVLAVKLGEAHGPRPAPAVLASSKTRKHMQQGEADPMQVDSDPWSHGRDPWSQFKAPPGLSQPSAGQQHPPPTPSWGSFALSYRRMCKHWCSIRWHRRTPSVDPAIEARFCFL